MSNPIPVDAPGVISGTDGDDRIDDTLGFVDGDGDVLTSEYVAHQISAAAGDDFVKLIRGDGAEVDLGSGDDTFQGNHFIDGIVDGGDGDDLIEAGRYSWEAYGGSGSDTIVGTSDKFVSTQVMTGGSDDDHFAFTLSATHTQDYTGIVTDFEVGIDTLSINGVVISGLAQSDLPADISVVQSGGDLVFTSTNAPGDAITLQGISEAAFFGSTPPPPPPPDDPPDDPPADDPTGVGVVDGTTGDDLINYDYIDAEGDQMENAYVAHVINAGDGNDEIVFNRSRDARVYGGDGDDEIMAHRFEGGQAFGGAGNDYVLIGHNNSFADGGTGDDTLVGTVRSGVNQTFTGGEGIDTFEIRAGTANQSYSGVITDFDVSSESLVINGVTLSGLTEAPSGFSTSENSGGDLVFSFLSQTGTATHSVTLEGVSEAAFFGDTPPPPPDDPPTGDPTGVGVVDGTTGDDLINYDYIDAEGDQMENAYVAHVINAGDGNDEIVFNRSRDARVYGGEGNDEIMAHRFEGGQAFGGAGNDYVLIGHNNSFADGGTGNDTLVGTVRSGVNQTFTGGEGIDAFEIRAGTANQSYSGVITDFDVSSESLVINGVTLSGLTEAPSGFSTSENSNGDLVFSFLSQTGTATHSVTLEGVSEAAFFGDTPPPPPPSPSGNGVVEGSADADAIGLGFEDSDGDTYDGSGQIVDAGGGNDTIISGTGDDTITTGTGADRLEFAAGSGTNRVTDFDINADVIVIDGATLDPDAPPTGVTLAPSGGDTVITYSGGQVTLEGVALSSWQTPADPGQTIAGTSGDDSLVGGTGNDTITGGDAGDDTLFGGQGDDTLIAKDATGSQATLWGGEGADTFILEFGAYATIMDFEMGIDQIILDGHVLDPNDMPADFLEWRYRGDFASTGDGLGTLLAVRDLDATHWQNGAVTVVNGIVDRGPLTSVDYDTDQDIFLATGGPMGKGTVTHIGGGLALGHNHGGFGTNFGGSKTVDFALGTAGEEELIFNNAYNFSNPDHLDEIGVQEFMRDIRLHEAEIANDDIPAISLLIMSDPGDLVGERLILTRYDGAEDYNAGTLQYQTTTISAYDAEERTGPHLSFFSGGGPGISGTSAIGGQSGSGAFVQIDANNDGIAEDYLAGVVVYTGSALSIADVYQELADTLEAIGFDPGDLATPTLMSGQTASSASHTVTGTFLNENIFGGLWHDLLQGGGGDDVIDGGAGQDTMTGGSGNDTFVFADGFGSDTITDFDAGTALETIDLTAVSTVSGYSDLVANHMTQVGADVVIDAGGGDVIVLADTAIGDLDQFDFVF